MAFKDQGNAAFKAGDTEAAIELYSRAIELDPENHVFYSNRAAAYLRQGDAKSKAFRDGKKCVTLAPSFLKGYGRKAAAEVALGRLEAACDTYRAALRLQSDHAEYAAALEVCKGRALEAKQHRLDFTATAEATADAETTYRAAVDAESAEAKAAAAAAAAASASASASASAAAAEPVDPLDGFFTDIGATEAQRKNDNARLLEERQAKARQEARKGKGQSDKYREQKLGTCAEQCARLLTTHQKWANLNPYLVLMLGTDASEDDLKHRYRKLSVVVHPDKNPDVEGAREVFEYVKTAYKTLCDDKKRERIVLLTELAREDAIKERQKLARKGMTEAMLDERFGELEKHLETAVMKKFAENEHRKQTAEAYSQKYNVREQQLEAAQTAKQKADMAFDKSWSKEGRQDARVADWSKFEDRGTKRTAQWSKQERDDAKKPKFGHVETETWKKSWK